MRESAEQGCVQEEVVLIFFYYFFVVDVVDVVEVNCGEDGQFKKGMSTPLYISFFSPHQPHNVHYVH